MKNSLLFILFLNVTSLLYSQDYKPLLDEYNEWNVRYCYGSCLTDIYYTNGDTIVDGMTYKVLDGYHYISRGFLLREDVPEKKVYLKAILPNGISDYLLYDFDLEVGDTIDMKNPITPFPENAGYYKVDSIISRPLVDGNNYRHFYFSPTISNEVSTNNAVWIEGVGSLSIITAPSGDPDIDGVGIVTCMFKNGISYYSDFDIVDECQPSFVLGIQDFDELQSQAKVINTSLTNSFEIVNLINYKSIDVFDLKGVKLDSYELNNVNSTLLNLTHYNPAMYLLVLNSQEYQKEVLKVIIR